MSCITHIMVSYSHNYNILIHVSCLRVIMGFHRNGLYGVGGQYPFDHDMLDMDK